MAVLLQEKEYHLLFFYKKFSGILLTETELGAIISVLTMLKKE